MSTTVTSPTFISKLNGRQEVAEGTMAFRFDKPAGWAFKPGQFVDMTLVDPLETDSEGDTRTFSIASAPHEETLMVTTRMRDTAFKRVLRAMPLGTTVKFEGPFGNLILQNTAARGCVVSRRDRHHSVPKHAFPCSPCNALSPHFPVLFEPATGGCSVPR